jgi:CheY-like chemotaxis protein
MSSLVSPVRNEALHHEPRFALMIAGDDEKLRSRVAAGARRRIEGLSVLQAEDGVEAIQLGLERRPQLALLDVSLPRVGGIEVALTLRALEPGMRFGVYADNPPAHRRRAREHRLPLFGARELEHALEWLALHAAKGRPGRLQMIALACSACGYGIARSTPPERCPMCQREATWFRRPWRPFTAHP